MDTERLKRFDLHFPGTWIEGEDRDWAFDVQHVLSLVEGLFVEAVASYALFQPITAENIRKPFEERESKYKACLNGVYAKAFVFALHVIEKLLRRLSQDDMHPSVKVQSLYDEYKGIFGPLKHIRDSAIHIEDRGRGVTRKQDPIPARILVIGGFVGNSFSFTGEDGKLYEVEISETTLEAARRLIQDIINVYQWIGPVLCRPEETEKVGLTT
jgi:hypothetical protein